MNSENHEQLTGGAGSIGGDDDAPVVKINPIPEGEITIGQSGEPTAWDKEPLREAVSNGVFDGAKIIKGEGGTNPHFPIDEQVPPENILGRVDSWTYEEGVGPVGTAQLADNDIARRVNLGLLDVSADMERYLGDFDEERGVNTVDYIDSVPRITVLDQGAARNATIEPARAEALGALPRQIHEDDVDASAVEQLASTHAPSYSGTSEGEWSKPAQSDFDTDDLSEIAGHFLASTSGFSSPDAYGDLKLPVVSTSGSLNLNALESAHQLASQTDGLSDDDVSAVRSTVERLASEEFDEDLTTEQNAPSEDGDTDASKIAEPAESGRDTVTDSESTMPETTKEELREQLAAARQDVEQKENQIDSLEDEKESVKSEKESLKEEKQSLEEALEDKDEKIGQLEEDTEHTRRRYATVAVGGNDAAADALVESDRSLEDLAEMALEADTEDDEEEEDDEDEQLSAVQRVEEQLAASPNPRGGGDEEPAGGSSGNNELTEEQLARADDIAYEVITGNDIVKLNRGEEQLSPREYAKQKTGVDPAECKSKSEFSRRVEAEGGDA